MEFRNEKNLEKIKFWVSKGSLIAFENAIRISQQDGFSIKLKRNKSEITKKT